MVEADDSLNRPAAIESAFDADGEGNRPPAQLNGRWVIARGGEPHAVWPSCHEVGGSRLLLRGPLSHDHIRGTT